VIKVFAIFDIGKTNKKFFLFDKHYNQVFKEYREFEEVTDDDGYACDDLPQIEAWMRLVFNKILQSKKFKVKSLNFSTYGASLVHIDEHYRPVTPLYNYLKPLPDELLHSFHEKYGDELTIARETASPTLGMLNAGLQLYWLKHTKPEVYGKISWSLFLPQYLSLLFTGTPYNEYTGLGCHTILWDFQKQDYHQWVYAEGIDRKLPAIKPTGTTIKKDFDGERVKVGIGIHDSSSALLPYIKTEKKPFILISTGTWSICLNPYNQDKLTNEDLRNDCLNFLSIDGKPVKASRLFLGAEYHHQLALLQQFYNKKPSYHQQVAYDNEICSDLLEQFRYYYCFTKLKSNRKQPDKTTLTSFHSFEIAYHQLILELVELQVLSVKRAIGNSKISKIYVDGGFAENRIFIKRLAIAFPLFKLRTTRSPLGSALGAVMAISGPPLGKKFLKKKYAMIKIFE